MIPRIIGCSAVIEPRKAALIFGDQLRIEAAGAGDHAPAAIAVTAVVCLIIVPEMMIHLGIACAFSKYFLQRIEQSALHKSSTGVAVRKQPIQKLMQY